MLIINLSQMQEKPNFFPFFFLVLALKWKIPFAMLSIVLLFFFACKSDETPTYSECGCGSETIDTVPSENFPEVPNEKQKSGLLFYKKPENIDGFYDEEQYNNRFWIFQGTKGCYNCKRNFIVCNEEILNDEFGYLKNNGDTVEVSFTGNMKRMCIGKITPADYFYCEITLKSIELR